MPTRQTPWPTRWLMTDERVGNGLWRAIAALPDDGGVVFRHDATPGRAALAQQVAAECRKRGLVLAVARDAELATAVGADLVHNPAGDPRGLPVSRSGHSLAEAAEARAAGARLLFVSPVYATASHPGAASLGLDGALAIARKGGMAAIALGGMDEERGKEAIAAGFHGWAGIDAWLRA